MFCDLVGSTALAEQLDPEELREVLRAYQDTCAAVIHRFGGHIAQYLGDGLLVYFGYPLANEDDPRRAVHTALGIAEAMAALNERLQPEGGVRLAVRLGIHTGLVVVGEMGGRARHEPLALGETPNLAARLQGLAEPDTVVISAATHRLVQRFFTCGNLGAHTLKGVSTPVQVYRVLAERPAQSRVEAPARGGLTPLVGREQEVALLLDRWDHVKEGLGHVVLLSGEPGLGKSRLLQVVIERVAGIPHARLEGRCSPYFQHTPLYPVIDLVQCVPQWARDDAPEERLRKLEAALTRYALPLPETVPLLASLLSLPLTERYPALTLSPERRKQKTLEVVLALLLAMAAHHPVLAIVEDLHWVDPSTLEFLTLLLDQVPTTRVFALLTARPAFHPLWTPRSHLTYLMLDRLPRKHTEVMIERVSGGKALPPEVLRQVVAKTDGVPLFVEELTKMILESGLLREQADHYELTGPLPPLAIPATLQDSLMARLDRLATVREVAQLAAALGRAFPYELLRATSPLDEGMLQRALTRLVEAELLHQRGLPPQAIYVFKHALIQEAAYQSLLKSTRERYHQTIAQVLVQQFPGAAETQPELVAHHYTEAGLVAQALPHWLRAGQRAIEGSAHAEGISHLTRGLELLKPLPETPERLQHELDMQTALGPALMATKGFGAPEVERVYSRALALCRQVGETPRLFPVLRGLWEFYELRGALHTARELAEQLLSLAERLQDPAFLLVAHDALGDTLLWSAEFRAAREHLEQGIALYDPQQHRALAFLHGGYDPGVACRIFAAHVLWYLGWPDLAVSRIEEAVARARELAHPFSLTFALVFAAWLYEYRRDPEGTRERAEAALALATEHDIAFFLAHGTILRGWALSDQGQHDEGIAQLHQGLAAYRATGAELERPHWLALLAEAYGKAGQPREGLALLSEALAFVQNTGIRFCEAELYRLMGDLRLLPPVAADDQAESCFHQALETARRQGAKSLELRAAMGLSRLWQRQGKREAARGLLAEVSGWFTEGSDTLDVQEAKALLQELS